MSRVSNYFAAQRKIRILLQQLPWTLPSFLLFSTFLFCGAKRYLSRLCSCLVTDTAIGLPISTLPESHHVAIRSEAPAKSWYLTSRISSPDPQLPVTEYGKQIYSIVLAARFITFPRAFPPACPTKSPNLANPLP